jgi:hypothetical protein
LGNRKDTDGTSRPIWNENTNLTVFPPHAVSNRDSLIAFSTARRNSGSARSGREPETLSMVTECGEPSSLSETATVIDRPTLADCAIGGSKVASDE